MRKKLRIVLMLCVLVITVCGCKKRQEPVFLLEPAYCNSEGLEKFVEFKSSADYGLSIVKDIVELDNVEKNIIPSFESDEEYEYSYSFVAKASLNGKDELYSQYNMYENSDNSIEVSYLDGTDIVTTYFNKGVIRQAVGAQPVSKEEALELSIDFLKKINSAKLINEYEYDESKDKEDEEYYYFDLVRKVNGYDTDDIIDVSVKKSGVVESFVMFEVDKYDKIQNRFSKGDLDYVKKKIEEKIDTLELENPIIEEARLRINVIGELFMELTVEFGPEGRRNKVPVLATIN